MKKIIILSLIAIGAFGCAKDRLDSVSIKKTLSDTAWISGKWDRTILYDTAYKANGKVDYVIEIPKTHTPQVLFFNTPTDGTINNNINGTPFTYSLDNMSFMSGARVWKIERNKYISTQISLNTHDHILNHGYLEVYVKAK